MALVSVAAMAVWIVTAIIGGYLLAAGISNEHQRAAETREPEPAPGHVPATGTAETATGHPLLEFCHPALAVTGLMFWIFFVVSDHFAFAWIAVGVLAVTALAGLTWLISGIADRRRARVPPGPVFPRHLVLLHGVAVTCTFTLVLLAATSHG